ncbi:MarR family transcriptional regulator [Paraburkholderia graminis]|uniref:DNA-binding MarR family transcriptional regulator n=1 Tax=Paraburkholderia graminis TaxID=60548 RepID=A0ABD5CDA0_9BURK|nr:MarR family transcriptional regulator [Paraburkholderia graminis]MDR6202530.1 DNA-binding MarR family transcriptional regulator [Paraburkholderia graminis]
MSSTNAIVKFHAFTAVYESYRAAAFGRSWQMSPFAARALEIIGGIPSLTLQELQQILGGSQGQTIGAVFDLQQMGFIEKIEERNDQGSLLLKPIRERLYAVDAYRSLVDILAQETGISEKLADLLPQYQAVLMSALAELEGEAQGQPDCAQRHILERLMSQSTSR